MMAADGAGPACQPRANGDTWTFNRSQCRWRLLDTDGAEYFVRAKRLATI